MWLTSRKRIIKAQQRLGARFADHKTISRLIWNPCPLPWFQNLTLPPHRFCFLSVMKVSQGDQVEGFFSSGVKERLRLLVQTVHRKTVWITGMQPLPSIFSNIKKWSLIGHWMRCFFDKNVRIFVSSQNPLKCTQNSTSFLSCPSSHHFINVRFSPTSPIKYLQRLQNVRSDRPGPRPPRLCLQW